MILNQYSLNKKRTGRFRIYKELISEHPNEIIDMFYKLKIIVVRAEMMYDKDVIEYIGISPFFKEIEPQYITPEYEIITHVDNGEYTYEVHEYDGVQVR